MVALRQDTFDSSECEQSEKAAEYVGQMQPPQCSIHCSFITNHTPLYYTQLQRCIDDPSLLIADW